MNWKSLLFVLAAVSMLIVAGCAAPEPSEPAPQQAEPESVQEPEPEPVVPGVSFVSVSDNVQIGKSAVIKWHVEGEGAIPHTAVHWGTKSRADVKDLTISTYPSMTPKGAYVDVEVPGDFEGAILIDSPIPVYLRAHAVIDGVDYWTEEEVVNFVVPSKSGSAMTDDGDAMEDKGESMEG